MLVPVSEAATATPVRPALSVQAPPAARAARPEPGWLLPVVEAAALLLLAGVAAVAFVSARGGAQPAPLAEQAAPVLAAVNSDVAELSNALSSDGKKQDVVEASEAAARLGRDAAQASSQLGAMKFRSSDEQGARLLARALTAAFGFAQKTKAAAKDPRAGTVGPARDAADATRSAFNSLATTAPALVVPPASQFFVDSISGIAAEP